MEILNLVNAMAPYLLLGFFLAGLMHAFVPAKLYQQHLGKPTFKSVLYSTMIAIPLPLCSCGVIPTAMSLRREGASKGSVIAFLIATPQTGVDSILATYSLMGLPFAIVRPIAALTTAILGGQATNILESRLNDKEQNTNTSAQDSKGETFLNKIKTALRYSFYEMMQDIGKWLVVGLILAGLITLYIPDTFFEHFANNTLLSILIVLMCAIPMYLCATGSIPIAIALMLKGLSPGAALVLLMAGPAVNVASILVIRKVMGTRTLLIYLMSIIAGATGFALIIDYVFPRDMFISPLIQNCALCHEGTPYFRWVCTALLFILLANALFRRFFVKKVSCSCASPASTCTCSVEGTAGADKANGTIFHIGGMKCNHCRANVEKAISSVNGVENVEADLQSGTAAVRGKFDSKEVIAAVEAIGFDAKEEKQSVITTTIHVEGMMCNHCRTNVEKAIAGVGGVEKVEADLQSHTATITGTFSMEKVKEAVEAIGFGVK